VKYILQCFKDVNRAHLDLYPQLIQTPADDSNLSFIFSVVKETIIRTCMDLNRV
jgi:hypothetical protein